MADQAYDLTEENFGSDGMLPAEKLSTFRRKRLAERKYEFTEEDGEEVEYDLFRTENWLQIDYRLWVQCPFSTRCIGVKFYLWEV